MAHRPGKAAIAAAVTLAVTVAAAGCGSGSAPNTADPTSTAATTSTTIKLPPATSVKNTTSTTAGTPTSSTLPAGLSKALYNLYVNSYNTVSAIQASPDGSPNDPRLPQVDTGRYLANVRGGIAQERSQGLVTKTTVTHLSGFKVVRAGPGGSWLANICNGNNGDNFNAKTGAQVTHTGYGTFPEQFTAVPGPQGTWRISQLNILPGSC